MRRIVIRGKRYLRARKRRWIRKRIARGREAATRRARGYVDRTPCLRELEDHYNAHSISTGVSVSDMAYLYQAVVGKRYKRILEFGSGASTAYIARALLDTWGDPSSGAKLYTMESIEKYYRNSMTCLPEHLAPWVEFRLSPAVVKTHSLLRGKGYEELPDGEFDLVFVDGPFDGIDGQRTMCIDVLEVLERQTRPFDIIVDNKKATLIGLLAALGPNKIRYDSYNLVGTIESVGKLDLVLTKDPTMIRASRAFFRHAGSFKI